MGRQTGIIEATHYNWKKRYTSEHGALEVPESRKLCYEMRASSVLAELTLDRHVLQVAIKKKI